MRTAHQSVNHDSNEGLPDSPLSLLRMAAGGEVLAVPIDSVCEILQVVKLTPLPRTPDFIRGVMNRRGSVMPVIDLAARLGRPPTEIGRRSCIVVVETNPLPDEDPDSPLITMVAGLLVDAVFEVFDCHHSDIEPAPSIGTRIAREHIAGMTRAHQSILTIVDLERLLAPSDLALDIAAFQPH